MKFLPTALALWLFQEVLANDNISQATEDTTTSRHLRKPKKTKSIQATSVLTVNENPPVSPVIAESRIVGGEDASVGEYPYFVLGNGCGASLIWKDIVLTAAHCGNAFNNRVLVGAYRYWSTNFEAEWINVAQTVRHPNYNGNTEANDFMIVKLSSASSATPVIINMDASNPSINESLTTIGFGATTEGGSGSNILQKVTLNYINPNICNSQYGGQIQEDIMMCAGVQGGGKDSCQGDSGGPIMDSDGVQVGVTSWGIGCARPNYPGVYSRISGVKDWINGQVCALSSDPPPSCGGGGGGDTGGGGGGGDSGGGGNDTGFTVRVVVKHDDYPEETGWTVFGSDNAVVLSQTEGEFQQDGGTVDKSAFVEEGQYTFKIVDMYGDGICCGFGRGEFDVYVNDERVGGGNGQFNSETSFSFTVGETSEEEPSLVFKVDAQYDAWPGEFSWWIQDRTTNSNIVRYNAGEVTEQNALVSETLDLVAGRLYTLRLRDSYGDGINVGGDGFVEVYAMVDGQKQRLIFNDGNFRSRWNKSFRVPADLSRIGDAVMIELEDSVDNEKSDGDDDSCTDGWALFDVSAHVGQQGCHWLADNYDRYEFLCEFVDVVVACPHTCGRCGLFV